MRNTKRKHMKEKGHLYIKNKSRFYSLLLILIGIMSIFVFKKIEETDMTGPIVIISFSAMAYISTFGEDK